ncbi:MAG: ribosome maturation factor RimM [Alphaproteobacteria bacterium]|nr:16S rRNA processing protein RimM [Rhodospirillaceae bacterium]MBT7612403.1 16S rRNA processing protein RimM [Rhodospirillaceae bacterium]MBT7645722.1 16S rRNA processing protein RimM [Rhodospirillaceae bacterium]MDG2481033.1 ribosome maturation factor RimM [Alphaproteobacteria bacterium]
MPRKSPPNSGSADPKDWVCLAVAGAPKGVRGALRLTCYNESPSDIAGFNPLHAGPGGRLLSVSVIEHPKPNQVVVKIEGIEDRDAAAALNGTRFFVPRSRMPEPEDDEFYHHDLIGLSVVDQQDGPLGTVRAVLDFGAGELLEVVRANNRSTFMLPFTNEVVPTIDLAAGRVVVDPPEGLIDDV